MMARSWLLQSIGALAAVLTFAPSASADKGPRFLASLHGGAATEVGGGATLELRVLDDICLGGGFDLGLNLNGAHGTYGYFGPAVHGSYGIRFADKFEVRPFFGARFPFGVKATDDVQYKIVDNASVAFTTALRVSYVFDPLFVGIQGDLTPHVVTWQNVSTGVRDENTEFLIRASLVVGIALGHDSP